MLTYGHSLKLSKFQIKCSLFAFCNVASLFTCAGVRHQLGDLPPDRECRERPRRQHRCRYGCCREKRRDGRQATGPQNPQQERIRNCQTIPGFAGDSSQTMSDINNLFFYRTIGSSDVAFQNRFNEIIAINFLW